jgi:hypothetical protein
MLCVLASAAAAKDLPRGRGSETKPVTGCEAFGPDFRKIEGSDSCIKVGGSMRAEYSYSSGGGSTLSPSGR